MRLISGIATLACACAAMDCGAAQQWTGCETVTGISNYPDSGALIVKLSPAVSGCSSSVNGVAGAITFQIGQNGIASADDLRSVMASLLTAYTSGRQVMIYYSTATGCPGELIANSGYDGQCP